MLSLSLIGACSNPAQPSASKGEEPPNAAVAAPQTRPLSPIDVYSAAHIGALYERPASGPELLRNIKLAFDLNLLLQPAFFTDENLTRFFAATAVVWQHQVGVAGDGFRDATVTFGNGPFSGTSISMREGERPIRAYRTDKGERVPAHTAKSGVVMMKFNSPLPDFTVEALRKVFGPAQVETGPERFDAPQRVDPQQVPQSQPPSRLSQPDAPVVEHHLRYEKARDLETRRTSHVEQATALFGIGANEMIAGVLLIESEM